MMEKKFFSPLLFKGQDISTVRWDHWLQHFLISVSKFKSFYSQGSGRPTPYRGKVTYSEKTWSSLYLCLNPTSAISSVTLGKLFSFFKPQLFHC